MRVNNMFYEEKNDLPNAGLWKLTDYMKSHLKSLSTHVDFKIVGIMVFARCATKKANPILDTYFESSDTESEFLDDVAGLLASQYGYKWETLYDTTTLSYNPIENYSMIEEETHEETGERGSKGNSNNKTELTGKNSQTNESDIYGFNSTSPHGDRDNSQEASNESNSTAETEFEQNDSSLDSGERRLTRSGNIGVMSTQDMIEKEREVAEFSIYEAIANDITKFLAINIW